MEGIRTYIVSVVAAAIVCAVAKLLIDQKSASGAVVKLIAGLLLTVTVIGPVTNIQFLDISKDIEDLTLSADVVVDTGTAYAAENTAAHLFPINCLRAEERISFTFFIRCLL